MPTLLSEKEIERGLASLHGWELQNGKLSRELKFDDFAAAYAFMTRVAIVAEKMNHHPDWSNVWNRVNIQLTTHDAGGITALDFELARKINEFSGCQTPAA